MPHQWPGFSTEYIDAVASVICPGADRFKYKLISESGSAIQDFTRNHSVLFQLVDGFRLRFGQRILGIDSDERWSAFLMRQNTRRHFISVINKVASAAGSGEGLLLPEGTILEDAFFEDISFDEIKRRAIERWGLPDLDAGKLYSEDELSGFGHARVHYFLISKFVKG